jgi:hypothetical protein
LPRSVPEDFDRLQRYRGLISKLIGYDLPITLCTIYNGSFRDPEFQRIAAIALAVFNDAIMRVALEHRLGVIDLRPVCAEPEDYVNAIEPSARGGARIADAIARHTLKGHFAVLM